MSDVNLPRPVLKLMGGRQLSSSSVKGLVIPSHCAIYKETGKEISSDKISALNNFSPNGETDRYFRYASWLVQ